jgi:cystathionine beta-synthase
LHCRNRWYCNRYSHVLKEKNPNIQIWAIDVYGSLLTKYFRTGEVDMNEVHPYISEGFGEDFVS